jgi:hypothetical protein
MSIGLLSLMAVGVLATACIWLIAFILNGLSLAQMDGANGKRHTSLRATLRRSLALTSRVSTAWLMLGLISSIMISIIGAPIAIYYYLHFLHTTPSLNFYVLSTVWSLLGLFGLASFSLMPQVALFEPSLPLIKTPLRSYQLVKRRGRLFVLALQAALAMSIAASLGATNLLRGIIDSGSTILFSILVTVLLISSQLMLTALYRKRKLARS